MKIGSEQKADIVRRIQVKNLDGTWAEKYGALAEEFGVSRCLISYIAKRAGLSRREGGQFRAHIVFVGKRYQPPPQLSDMYQELRSKVGVTEARRLIEDHMRIRGLAMMVLLLMSNPSPLEAVKKENDDRTFEGFKSGAVSRVRDRMYGISSEYPLA